ncbi:MAG: cell division protein FtsZ, partial [Pseudomonadota bacterium]
DAQALASSSAERRIQMGNNVTEGLGAGSKPEIGATAAEEAMADVKAHLVGCHMAFITAGMGGGTGTGAAPVIARASREEGILTVGVVTKPFQFEGSRRMRAAEAGIEELQKYVDTLLIIPNQNLFRVANEKTTFTDAFGMADDVLRSGVGCITDLMVKEGLINLDFADVRTIMAGMGKAMMGTGEASGERRAIDAAEAAISNPLLDDVCMKGSSGLLVSITGGSDLTLYEVDEAASRIRAEADEDANIIVGATYDDELDGIIRVSVVATGIGNVSADDKPAEAASERAEPDRGRLTERLAGLSMPAGNSDEPVDLDESLIVPAPEPAEDTQVWRATNDVTIEKRPKAASGITLPRPPAAPKPAEAPSNFEPAPPAPIKRAVRRMPNVEELPVVAQKALQAKAGTPAAMGLDAQKKKVGFLERLAKVGRGKSSEDAEMSPVMEPDVVPAPVAAPPAPRPQAPRPQVARPQVAQPQVAHPQVAHAQMSKAPMPPTAMPQAPMPQAPRPQAQMAQAPTAEAPAAREAGPHVGPAPAPRRLEVRPPRAVHSQGAAALAQVESLGDDDLEIPAFLRRRAN